MPSLQGMSRGGYNVLILPSEVLIGGVFPHLSLRELQNFHAAFSSTPLHQARITQLWNAYTFNSTKGQLTIADLKWLWVVGAKLKSACVHFGDYGTQTLQYLVKKFPALKVLCFPDDYYHLKAGFIWLDDSLLMELARGCPRLEELSLPKQPTSLTNSGIRAMIDTCKHLHTLNLSFHKYLTTAAFENVCLNRMRHLVLASCRKLTDATLRTIARNCPQLKSINISGTNCSTAGVIELANYCHELEELILCGCRRVTDAAVITVAENCPQLRILSIYRCLQVSNEGIYAIAEHCNNLTYLNARNIQPLCGFAVRAVSEGCKKLRCFKY